MPATVVSFGYLDTDSSKMNGTADGATHHETIRKISEDLSRKRLTDVEEGDENGEDVDAGLMILTPRRNTSHRDRKSSSASITSNTSLDTLWELHPRRLSEAGLRRTSDTSIVLTEDTDSFIIGQRVWVGGTKPGLIAYIGDTQFAPGEWAGIVLDEPIGKNDGSVAGTRYFQCEPRRGVFSRLTRLTRAPLPQAYADIEPSPIARNSISGTTAKPPRGGGSSPTGSSYSTTNSLKRAPGSLTTSNTSLSSAYTDLKVGDRVIVRSSATTGSKAGILRFIGQTEFAPGEWCGVELDEPIGKNDGSVDGIRYFDCQSFYGLFAPVAKVTRSPSTRRPAGCAVHRPGIRRTGSRESLNSTTTSLASSVRTAASSRVRLGVNSLSTPMSSVLKKSSTPKSFATPLTTKTALQDALREKEAQVTKLLKERELERAEITRAASQADHAEQLLASLTNEYEQFRKECELRLKEKDGNICKIQSERDNLISQLDEEKRHGEDLQFKFEEAAINKVDVEKLKADQNVVNDTHVTRIKELENLLSEERKKVEAHENESNKLFEAEEAYARTKEELEVLQEKIKSIQSSDEIVTSSLQTQLDEYKNKLQESEAKQKELEIIYENDMLKLKSQSDEKCQSQKTEFNTVSENYKKEIDLLKQQMSETQDEKKKMDAIIQKQMNEMSKLRIQTDEQSHKLQQKTKDVCDNALKTEEKLQKEIDKLKMELSGKAFDIEASIEKNKNKDMLINELQVKLDAALRELKTKEEDMEKHVRRKREADEEYQRTFEDMKANLQASADSLESHKIATAKELMSKQSEIAEAQQKHADDQSFITKLEYELNETKAIASKSASSIVEYELQLKYLKEKDDKILELNSMYESTCHRLADCHDFNVKQELELHQKDAQIETYKKDFEVLYVKMKKGEDDNCNLTARINELELEVGDLTRKIASMQEVSVLMTEQKQKLEIEIQNLLSSSYDSNDKITKLNEDLRGKERELDLFREETNVKQLNCERETQELQQMVATFKSQHASKKTENDQLIIDLTNQKAQLEEEINIITVKARTVEDQLKSELKDLSTICENRQTEFNLQIQTYKQKEADLNLKINELLIVKEGDIKTYNGKIQQLEKDKDQLQNTIREKSDLLIEVQTKCERMELDVKAKEVEMNNRFAKNINRLQEDIKDLEKKISDKDIIISEFHMQMNVCKQDSSGLNESVLQYIKLLDNLKVELTTAQNDYTHLEKELGNKVYIISTLETQIEELKKNISDCENENSVINNELHAVTQELNNQKQDKINAQNKTVEKEQEIIFIKNQFDQTIKGLCKPLEEKIIHLTSQYNQAQNELNDLKKNSEEIDKSKRILTVELEKAKQEKCIEYEDSLIKLFNLQQECESMKKEQLEIIDIKDQEIDNLQKRLEQMKQDKEIVADEKYKELEKQYEVALKEKDEIKKQCMSVESQVLILNKNIDEVQKVNRTKFEEKVADIEKQCEKYVEEIENGKKELKIKDNIIKNLQSNVNVCAQKHNEDIKKLRKEVEQKNEALAMCKSKQNDECTQLLSQLEHKENELIMLRSTTENCKGLTLEVNRQANELSNKNIKIDELNRIISDLKKNITTTKDFYSMETAAEDSRMDCYNLKEQITKLRPFVDSTNKLTAELHREKLYIIDIETKLQQLIDENKDLTIKMQSFITRFFNNNIKKSDSKHCIKEKDSLFCQIKSLQVEMEKLVEEIHVCKTQKSQIVEEYNMLLENKHQSHNTYPQVTETLNKTIAANTSVVNGNVALQMEKLQEAQGQIEFLNSIIADMQQKNDELRNKVQVLESTSLNSEGYEISLHGVIQPRAVAPRMFCDICDSFDLHETEDCPHQSNDSPPSQRKITHHVPKEVTDRPYCEICEVFGHSTENCDDTETY